ncbi:MAG: hypothetical protein ACREFT_06625 [Acetobacteraceae bacterium]
MNKLVLSLASTALMGGLGVAYAGTPTPLTAAAMDGITAAGEQTSCDQNYSRDSRHRDSRTYQRNSSFLSPQVNVAQQTNVSPNVSVISLGHNDQETNNHQSSSQSNFNGNISR